MHQESSRADPTQGGEVVLSCSLESYSRTIHIHGTAYSSTPTGRCTRRDRACHSSRALRQGSGAQLLVARECPSGKTIPVDCSARTMCRQNQVGV